MQHQYSINTTQYSTNTKSPKPIQIHRNPITNNTIQHQYNKYKIHTTSRQTQYNTNTTYSKQYEFNTKPIQSIQSQYKTNTNKTKMQNPYRIITKSRQSIQIKYRITTTLQYNNPNTSTSIQSQL